MFSLFAMHKKENNLTQSITAYDKKNNRHASYVLFLFIFYCYAFFVTLVTRDFYAFETVFYFPIFYFILLGGFDRNLFFYKVFSLIRFSVWIFLIVDVVQYLFFYFFNRLPALAYEGSVSVRFGSLQDDPNGYAFLMSSFYFIGYYYRGIIRCFFYVLFIVNILLTISFTGIASVSLAIALVILLSSKMTLNKLMLYVSFFMASIVIVVIALQLPIVNKIILTKQGSIEQHAHLFLDLTRLSFTDVFGLSPSGWTAESTYINIMLNFGVIIACLFYLLVVSIIYRYCRYLARMKVKYKCIKKEPVYILGLCALSFSLSIFIGGVNLPLEVVFPVNALFPFFLSLLCIIPSYRYALDESY